MATQNEVDAQVAAVDTAVTAVEAEMKTRPTAVQLDVTVGKLQGLVTRLRNLLPSPAQSPKV